VTTGRIPDGSKGPPELEGPGVAIEAEPAGDAGGADGGWPAGLAGTVVETGFVGDGDVGPGPQAMTTIERRATLVAGQAALRRRVGGIRRC
jgi:hypothetical protein